MKAGKKSVATPTNSNATSNTKVKSSENAFELVKDANILNKITNSDEAIVKSIDIPDEDLSGLPTVLKYGLLGLICLLGSYHDQSIITFLLLTNTLLHLFIYSLTHLLIFYSIFYPFIRSCSLRVGHSRV